MGSFRPGDVPALHCALHAVPWRHGTDSLQVSLEHAMCEVSQKEKGEKCFGGSGYEYNTSQRLIRLREKEKVRVEECGSGAHSKIRVPAPFLQTVP